MLLKAKGLVLALFKLKFLFSFLAFLWLYAAMFGWRYGVGIAVCILIHGLRPLYRYQKTRLAGGDAGVFAGARRICEVECAGCDEEAAEGADQPGLGLLWAGDGSPRHCAS